MHQMDQRQQSAKMFLVTVLWNAKGIIFINYLEKGKTVTDAGNAALSNNLQKKTITNRAHLGKKCLLLSEQCTALIIVNYDHKFE